MPSIEESRHSGTATEIDAEKNITEASANQDKGHESDGSEFKQDGVRAVEAITMVWSKKMLWVTFVLLWLVTFVDMLLQSVQSNLIPYVTSSFAQHGLLATTGIVAAVLGGVSKLAIAKIIDIWGRVEGLAAMLFLIVIGMIMKATCQNVEMYAAAHTLYWVGHLGLTYIIDVVLADMTTLKNRAIMFGVNAFPTVATTFAGPAIAELFYQKVNFRWAFGAFCIILVVFCAPVGVIFFANRRKSLAMGIAQRPPSGRNVWQSVKHYFIELDVVGMFLTVAGWSLLLLPFNLASTAPNGWRTDYVIAMIVVGFSLLVAFVLWEKYFATVPYFPFRFLKDRTILGASLLQGFMFASIFCWDTYYQSYLQVVHQQSITTSGYILNSFSLASAFFGPFIGLIMRYTGEYKWMGMSGIPFVVLGTVLLIHFRTPETAVGYLVMCQIFNGIGTGIWSITGQMGVMASVNHQEVAVALALYSMFGSIGSGIGQAVAGSLWTNTLFDELVRRLPEEFMDQAATIYGDIEVQMSYPMGSDVRNAINGAYADVQRKMVIAGSAFLPILVICVVVWKNISLKQKSGESGQPKGNVW